MLTLVTCCTIASRLVGARFRQQGLSELLHSHITTMRHSLSAARIYVGALSLCNEAYVDTCEAYPQLANRCWGRCSRPLFFAACRCCRFRRVSQMREIRCFASFYRDEAFGRFRQHEQVLSSQCFSSWSLSRLPPSVWAFACVCPHWNQVRNCTLIIRLSQRTHSL